MNRSRFMIKKKDPLDWKEIARQQNIQKWIDYMPHYNAMWSAWIKAMAFSKVFIEQGIPNDEIDARVDALLTEEERRLVNECYELLIRRKNEQEQLDPRKLAKAKDEARSKIYHAL